MLKFKICIAGDKGVGKSSLISRYVDQIFYEKTVQTIGVAFKKKELKIKENLQVYLNIWDFGGEEKYRILFPAYVNGATAALLLYDTTNRKSLDDLKNWVQIIDDNTKEIIKVTIGTKTDLKEQQKISKADAAKISSKFNCYGEPIGTSSKTGENVEKAFHNVVEAIIERNLQECKSCGKFFSIELKYCNFCGEKTKISPITP